MKIVTFADAHVSHRAPASRTDDYEVAIFAKLAQVTAIAVKVGATAVVTSGDLFHLKTGVPHALVVRLLEWAHDLRGHGIELLGIPGNHDETHNRYESIPGQPLGVLFASGAMVDVSFKPRVLIDDRVSVTVCGVPYPHATRSEELIKLQPHDSVYGLLLLHCFASIEGGDVFGEKVHSYRGLAHLPYQVFVLGHDHRDQGIVKVAGKTFINVGALSRGSLSSEDLARDVKVAVVEFTPTEITAQQVKLKVAPAREVFDLELHQEKKAESAKIAAFVAELQADALDAGGMASIADRMLAFELPLKVRERIWQYIEQAEA